MPHLTPQQADFLLDRINDYAACSNLHMYAWARRRELQIKHTGPKAVIYAQNVEQSMASFAEDAYAQIQEILQGMTKGEFPEIKPENNERTIKYITDLNKNSNQELQQMLAEGSVKESQILSSAAAGFAVSYWRDVVEPWHYFFTDAQMSWMSLIATRDILPFFNLDNHHTDPNVINILTDPEREVLPGVNAKDAFGPAWKEIAGRIQERGQRSIAQGIELPGLVYQASFVCPRWWGCYDWNEVAHTAAIELQLGPRQTKLLIETPYKLSFTTWERVIQLIHEN